MENKPAPQEGTTVIQNPLYRNWWQRSIFRKWLRDLIGVTEDEKNGNQLASMLTNNIVHQAKLLQGQRADIDAANAQQNPINEIVIELKRRLEFYEHEVGTGLAMSAAKLKSIDAREREQKQKDAMKVELDAANKKIAERKHKLEIGEYIDCQRCEGEGMVSDEGHPEENEGKDICPVCEGSGVVPNPEYTPDGVKRILSLER